jgi:hypothetical protein
MRQDEAPVEESGLRIVGLSFLLFDSGGMLTYSLGNSPIAKTHNKLVCLDQSGEREKGTGSALAKTACV